MIVGLAHVNLIVPSGTLEQANEFYGSTLGLTNRPVPHLQKDRLAWFDIGSSGQQVHIAFGPNETESSRHPCFKIESQEKLLELQQKVWEHYERKDGASPRAADKPGEANSGMLIGLHGVEADLTETRQVQRVSNIRAVSSQGTMLAIGWSSVCERRLRD